MSEIDYSEWQQALAELEGPNDEGMTATELMKLYGINRSRLHLLLEKGIREGKFVKGTGRRTDSAGRIVTSSVYRIVNKVL